MTNLHDLDLYAKLIEEAKHYVLEYEKSSLVEDEKQLDAIIEKMNELWNQALNYKIDIRASKLTMEQKITFKKLRAEETIIKKTFNKMQLKIYKPTAISLSRDDNVQQDHSNEPMVDMDVMVHGRAVQNESINRLKNAIKITVETNALAAETALKINQQGEQMEKIDGIVAEIDSELKRARAVLKRTLRRVATNKFLWVMIGLIVIGIGGILALKIV